MVRVQLKATNEQPPKSAVVSTGREAGRASSVHQGPRSEGGTLAVKAIEPKYKTYFEDVGWRRYATDNPAT
jgi:hypothetical protein